MRARTSGENEVGGVVFDCFGLEDELRARATCDWCCLAAGVGQAGSSVPRETGGGSRTGHRRQQDGEADGGADRAGGAVH